MAHCNPSCDVALDPAEALGDRIVDRLERREAVASLGDRGPCFGGEVVVGTEGSYPAVPLGIDHGRIRTPPEVRRCRNDCPVVGPRLAMSGLVLRRQQAVVAH